MLNIFKNTIYWSNLMKIMSSFISNTKKLQIIHLMIIRFTFYKLVSQLITLLLILICSYVSFPPFIREKLSHFRRHESYKWTRKHLSLFICVSVVIYWLSDHFHQSPQQFSILKEKIKKTNDYNQIFHTHIYINIFTQL